MSGEAERFFVAVCEGLDAAGVGLLPAARSLVGESYACELRSVRLPNAADMSAGVLGALVEV
jgi:hypothetical protein